ncbi:NAD-dependent epimerase/dehydratase family protein [Actinoplanes sp. GCM10030250]|uniref:NAD-dependent epimerase/dehydratase family protein n=1 Tax=Actinoplanes sp. GCM10030250 TaxID=3273376 RepID=UPI00360BC5BA
MRILVLGGSGFVGRTLAEQAVARGDTVTVFNRGRRDPVPGAHTLLGDRLAPGGLAALGGGTWDAVVDTWSAGAEPIEAAARLLAGRAGHFTYVSSRSVYRYGQQAPLTEEGLLADPADPGYAGDKLRGEQAAAAFGGPLLLARAGLILGPHEDVGRLPWWLRRLRRGGPALAPGPRELPLQYVDARDLAGFVLDAAAAGHTGAYNVVSEPGHTTMGELLETAAEVTGGRAELRWAEPEVILGAGIEAWTQLPVWLPPGPEHDFMHRGDVSKALAAGLRCRPVRETVADTWAWLSALDGPAPLRTDRPPVGLDPEVEAKVLAGL